VFAELLDLLAAIAIESRSIAVAIELGGRSVAVARWTIAVAVGREGRSIAVSQTTNFA
jgi:hypothetical protein